MYTVTVEFEIREGFETAFLERVQQQARDSLALEADCHRFDVSANTGPPLRVFLYELYTDAAAFDAHLASDHFKSFDAGVAEMIARKSVVRWSLMASG